MKLLIFGGTTEGRTLSRLLADRGAQVTVSVATDYGREEQGVHPGITVLTGRRNQAEMEALLRDTDLCVDATHPYAVEATQTIRAACQAAGVPCRRLLRKGSASAASKDSAKDGLSEDMDGMTEGVDCVTVADTAEAAAYLRTVEGSILLTTGSKELYRFSALNPARLFPRILPTHAGLDACEALGIPHRNIIAMQGPFTRELNEALIRQFHIAYLVTKDGGAVGGFPEKAAAAKRTGAVLVWIRRPEETGESFAEIAAACEKMIERGRQRKQTRTEGTECG